MVGLSSVAGKSYGNGAASYDQLQRVEQAAGFSMVTFESDPALGEAQDVLYVMGDGGEHAAVPNDRSVTRRVASMIDDCTATVTSYLRLPSSPAY